MTSNDEFTPSADGIYLLIPKGTQDLKVQRNIASMAFYTGRTAAIRRAKARTFTSGRTQAAYGARRAYRQAYNYIPRRMRGYVGTRGYYGRYTKRPGGGHRHQRPELKFIDSEFNQEPIVVSGNRLTTLGISQGTGESQRIGRKCTIKLISWRYSLTLKGQISQEISHDQVKLYIIWDKQTNGVLPLVSDIIEGATINGFRNLSFRDRFRVLATRKYAMANPAGAGDSVAQFYGTDLVCGEMNVKVNMPIEYDGVIGGITEIRSNNILLIAITLDGRIKIESRIRVRFEG